MSKHLDAASRWASLNTQNTSESRSGEQGARPKTAESSAGATAWNSPNRANRRDEGEGGRADSKPGTQTAGCASEPAPSSPPQETLAGIVAGIAAEMRTEAEGDFPYDDGKLMVLAVYADRLEAAVEREKSAPVSDTAFKREMSKNLSKNGADFGQLGDAAAGRPVKNADRFATLAEALLASSEMTADAPGLAGMGKAQLVRFVKWLFAPAKKERGAE